MKIFSALFGEINGVFGKAYLLAGLLPALVLVFCGTWYVSGGSAAELVNGLVKSTEEDPLLGKFAAAALLAIALGVVFFAGRSWLMATLQTFPGRRLRWINELLVHRQLRKRKAAKRDEERQNHILTVVDWADPKTRNFDEPGSVPWFIPRPKKADMESTSRKARKIFASLRERRSHTPFAHECRSILAGLLALYAYAFGRYQSAEVVAQIDLWRNEIKKPDGWVVLEALQDLAHRSWVDSTRARDKFPIENKWVGPTQLGTRAAALDDYAQERYGIDTSLLLSRLTGVLGSEDKEGLSDSHLSVETLVNLSAAAAGISLLVLARSIPSVWAAVSTSATVQFDWRGLAFFLAGLSSSVVLYRGALHAFGGLTEKTTRAIDLNRLALLKQMGFVNPADMSAERELWSQLAGFLAPGKPTLPVPDPPLHEPK